ncbi:hypothetical protein MHBO_002848 [Bonamia ostreae]|uniref:Cysteine-rich PDZ-binding protein n=1 Tax=Bonamia ostreae TaxID=126728 RepID=A0ABV2ANR3_9EUKA
MVCTKCQKKLSTIVVPDTWKEGSRNSEKVSHRGKKPGQTVKLNMLKRSKEFLHKIKKAKFKKEILSHLQALCPPRKILLCFLRLQKWDLFHVWQEDTKHQNLQTNNALKHF